MQIQMQAFAKRSGSLRRIITEDLARREHEVLCVREFLNVQRSKGWAKVLGRGIPGALNIEWSASQRMLTIRAIAKKGNKPYQLLGVFMQYLLERHGTKITNINIQLR